MKVDRGVSGEQAGEYMYDDNIIIDIILMLLFVMVARQQEIRTKRNYEHQKKAGKCSHFALFLSLLDYFRFYWSVFLKGGR